VDEILNDYDKKTEVYEDVSFTGSFTIASLNLNEQGNQLMYSRNPDFYQYRVLVKHNDSWVEDIQ
jgi:hypothetical protein